MKKHIYFFISLIALVFAVEGVSFIVSAQNGFSLGLITGAWIALFVAFVHFFIVYGLLRQKKWAPHLGIFFELYLVVNFIISNKGLSLSPTMLPSALTVLCASAFLALSLFVLRNQFKH